METATNIRKKGSWWANTPRLLFVVRKDKANTNGTVPIYARITTNGKRAQMSIGASIPTKNWAKGEIKGNTENLLQVKQQLEAFEAKFNEAQKSLLAKGEVLTSKLIAQAMFPKPVYTPTFFGAFKDFLKNKHSLIGIDINQKTYQNYVRTHNTFKAFLKQNNNINDLEFSELKAKLGIDFFHWLRTVKKCSPRYASKLVTRIKAVIDFSIIQDYTQTNPLKPLTFKTGAHKEVVYLSIEQLKRLINTGFELQALNVVKDGFLFQCYTGLAYVDLCNFSTEHIQMDASGRTWIIISRKKTGGRSTIPILPEAQAIIEKYANIDKQNLPRTANKGLLPVYANQVMNRLLKQIGQITGIGADVMCTHTARKTFATTALNTNGVSIETVSAMLGHANIKMTQQHYARVSQNKIGNEMTNFQFVN